MKPDVQFILQLYGWQMVAYRSETYSDLHSTLGFQFEPPAGMTENNLIGYAQFDLHTDVKGFDRYGLPFFECPYLTVSAVMVDAAYQRQGIASAMYDYAEAVFHISVRPATMQTEASKAFWKARFHNRDDH